MSIKKTPKSTKTKDTTKARKKSTKGFKASANDNPNKPDKSKTMEGNWIVNIAAHFTKVITAGIAEKRLLVKDKQFDKEKKKNLRYVLQPNGKFKKAKKTDKGKDLVNVYFD